jgi:hypothetical protein
VKVNSTQKVPMKLTLKAAKQEAQRHGGKCLSRVYSNCYSKLKWQCFRGHRWEAPLHNVMSKGSWCPDCSSRRLTIQTAQDAAKEYGGRCLSTTYTNNKIPLRWECKLGHHWKAALDNVKNKGNWCPKCKMTRKQGKLQIALEKLFGLKSIPNYRKFKWLVNPKTGCRLEVDIWFPRIKLAVEYDGEQHFKRAFGNTASDLQETKYRDRLKDALMHTNKRSVKWFIRFSYKDDLSDKAILAKLLKTFPKLKAFL